ncbi:MAG TPA: hypothetical protein ENK66_10575, partial [Arcobacter sp.]|nr:hypothetical protein [Arcobacter sp.]
MSAILPINENQTIEFKTSFQKEVINTIVAFSNTKGGKIYIGVNDDKIVISSPGKLYDDMTLDKIQSKNYQSSLRNKLVAEAFYLTAKTEKYGTGFIRIDNELKDFPNVTYEFKEIANALQITFFKNTKNNEGVNGGVNGSVNGGVNGGVNEVYNYIKNNPDTKA